ncbi:MAG: hypothetical protein HQM10_06690 [Candidatus Riflebacteria bacterium]|nr:hypothetical protein [Candidatus Riflebacteria bacterium]
MNLNPVVSSEALSIKESKPASENNESLQALSAVGISSETVVSGEPYTASETAEISYSEIGSIPENISKPSTGTAEVDSTEIVDVPPFENIEERYSIFDAIVEKALSGYNSANYEVYFSDFSDTVKINCTEYNFTHFLNSHLNLYGKYISKKLNKDGSVPAGDYPMIAYSAKFEKSDVRIIVNFAKEKKSFKIMSLGINL